MRECARTFPKRSKGNPVNAIILFRSDVFNVIGLDSVGARFASGGEPQSSNVCNSPKKQGMEEEGEAGEGGGGIIHTFQHTQAISLVLPTTTVVFRFLNFFLHVQLTWNQGHQRILRCAQAFNWMAVEHYLQKKKSR